jgi:very-short-patch-repair endonuclease
MPVRISPQHLKQLLKRSATKVSRETRPTQAVRRQLPPEDGVEVLKAIIRLHGAHLPPYQAEYEPFERTNHRIDICFPTQGVGIEVQGGRHELAGGRHSGDADIGKMNRLAILGWKMLQFTPTMLANDPLGCITTIEEALARPALPLYPSHGGKRPRKKQRKR